MLTQVASRGWKSRLAIVGVISMAASCGIQREEASPDVVSETAADLTAGAIVAAEAESLARTASAIGSKVTTDAAASGGKYVEFSGTAGQAGSWIQFVLPNIAAGPYGLTFLYKANNNRGIVQASIDGTDVGSPCNEYAASPAFRVVCSLGDKTLSAGNHNIRFRVTGKGTSSSGYQLVVDQIVLTFKGQCTTLSDCSAGYQACVANQCVCRQKTSTNKLTNPGFDGDASGWMLLNGGAFRASPDADSCPRSGAIALAGTGSEFTQCISVNVAQATRYYFSYRYQNWDFNAGQAGSGMSYCYLSYISGGSGCTVDNVTGSSEASVSTSPGTWIQASSNASVPAGTTGVMFRCMAVLGTGFYDQIYLSPTAPPAPPF